MRTVNRKKAEISLTVVVSAVIALVVLIVLIYIFINSSQKSSTSFGSCGISGGYCTSACKAGEFPISGLAAACKGDPGGSVCCSNGNNLLKTP